MSADENKNPQPDIEVSQKYSVAAPRPTTAYLIPVAVWARLKRDVSRLPPPSAWLQNVGWVLAGVAGGSFSTMAAGRDLSFKTNTISWLLIGGSVALALAFIFLDSRHSKDLHKTAQIVIFEMGETETAYRDNAKAEAAEPQ
jgi:hypothetical protein